MWQNFLKKIILGGVFFSALYSAQAATPTPIQIGVIYNLSGRQAPLDDYSLAGAKLAVAEINAAGGVLGRPLQLVIENGQTQPEIIQQAAKNLAADSNIVAVMGLNDTDMALAAIPTLAAGKKLFITSGATSPNLPNTAPGWVFLACFSDNEQAAAAADFVFNHLADKSVFLIHQIDNAYPQLLSNYFTQRFQQLGGTISAKISFDLNHSDIQTDLNNLHSQTDQAKIIYLAAGPTVTMKIINEIRQAGFKQPIIGGDSFDSNLLQKLTTVIPGTIYFTTHAFIEPQNSNVTVQKFIHLYQATYHKPPDSSFAGLGYDTVSLLAQAISQAKSTDPAKIRSALLQINNFDGVTGTISYQGTSIPKKSIAIVEMQKGQRTLVKSSDS